MEREIGGFLAHVGTERGLSPKTVVAYRHDLGKFAEFAKKELGKDYKVSDIDQYTIKAYMQFLGDTCRESW